VSELKDLLEQYRKPDVVIEEITLKLSSREFCIEEESYNTKSEGQQKQNIKDLKKELQTGNCFYLERLKQYGRKGVKIYYFRGICSFKKNDTQDGSIKIDVNLTPQMINALISMSMDNVCNIGEQQIKSFQAIFLNHIEKSKKDLKSYSDGIEEKISYRKEGLLKRLGLKND
jgi:hypothetical protein